MKEQQLDTCFLTTTFRALNPRIESMKEHRNQGAARLLPELDLNKIGHHVQVTEET